MFETEDNLSSMQSTPVFINAPSILHRPNRVHLLHQRTFGILKGHALIAQEIPRKKTQNTGMDK